MNQTKRKEPKTSPNNKIYQSTKTHNPTQTRTTTKNHQLNAIHWVKFTLIHMAKQNRDKSNQVANRVNMVSMKKKIS